MIALAESNDEQFILNADYMFYYFFAYQPFIFLILRISSGHAIAKSNSITMSTMS